MPAEWEPHRGTWLSWPRPGCISFPGRFPAIHSHYRRLVHVLAEGERIFLNVAGPEMEREARKALEGAGRVDYHHHPTDEPWCRDHGPIFVRDSGGRVAVTDWDYDAWGGKYRPFDRDDAIPGLVARLRGCRRLRPGMVLEGGSIDVNGQGLLLTTRSCLPVRNPGMPLREIERHLRRHLGVRSVLWLEGGGLCGDDTDGHVDNIARFVSAGAVVAPEEADPADPNHSILAENMRQLRRHARRHGLEIVPLPMPGPVVQEGERLPASYANFYIANKRVVVPAFGDPEDSRAQSVLARLFPGRKVVALDATEFIWGYGSFHCLTQQEPEGDYLPPA